MSKSSGRVAYHVTRTVGMPGQNATKSPGSAASLDLALPAAGLDPASVNVAPLPSRVSRVERDSGQLAVAIEPATVCNVFGVADPSVATRLLSQLLSVVQPDPHKRIDVATIDHVLTLIEGIRPADTLEAMTATMLIGAQHAALDSLRRASHPGQTPAGRQIYTALSLKAMRTFALLLDALNHGRGKGVTQQIIVKHVTVKEGAQAVIGAIDARTGRG